MEKFKKCPRCKKNNYHGFWLAAPVPDLLKDHFIEEKCPQCKEREIIGEVYGEQGTA